jgi:Asp-tRNA(Asn)/Glu-tRNA(Gln) amidotransferase A subunit family amidase
MAAGVRAGELSAAELVADALSAAAALDPVLHFVNSLTPHPALEAAARIDGLPLGQRLSPPAVTQPARSGSRPRSVA